MKKKPEYKKTSIIICIIGMWLILFMPLHVMAADLLIYADGPVQSKKGNEVVLNISVKNNPTITTLGLQVKYDKNVLHYVEATWNSKIISDSNNIMLVSEVDSGDSNLLNVSLVSADGYASSDTMVSLIFEASADFSSFPFTIIFRDSTDKELKSILDYKIETIQNLEDEKIQESTKSIQNQDSDINNVGQKDINLENVTKENYDKTFQTGNVDTSSLIMYIIIICLGIFVTGMIIIKKIK